MTRVVQFRCIHCLDRYVYQSSGSGTRKPYNDGTYCPTCKKAIVEALSKVPKVKEKVLLCLDDPREEEEVLEAYAREKESPSENLFGIPVSRAGAGSYLHDKGGSCVDMSSVLFVTYEGAEYRIETWREGTRPISITKIMEKDLRTGHCVPWRNFPR